MSRFATASMRPLMSNTPARALPVPTSTPIAWRGVRVAAAPTQASLLATLDVLLRERAAQTASG